MLVTQWAACGIVAAAARFVPVPMLDDVVRERAARVAVSRTLRAHGRNYSPELLEPLWGEHPACRRRGDTRHGPAAADRRAGRRPVPGPRAHLGCGLLRPAMAQPVCHRAEPEGGRRVGESEQRVTEVLRQPEIARLLDDFDARVNATLTAAP